MRVIEGKTYGAYTLAELEARYPGAYEHAIDVLRDRVMADEFALDQTMGELMASLRGMAAMSGVDLKDWSIGTYGYAHLSVTFPTLGVRCKSKAIEHYCGQKQMLINADTGEVIA